MLGYHWACCHDTTLLASKYCPLQCLIKRAGALAQVLVVVVVDFAFVVELAFLSNLASLPFAVPEHHFVTTHAFVSSPLARTQQNNILGISRIILCYYYWAIAFLHLLKGNKIPDRWWCMKWFSLGYYYYHVQQHDMVNKSCICSKLLRTHFLGSFQHDIDSQIVSRQHRRMRKYRLDPRIQLWEPDPKWVLYVSLSKEFFFKVTGIDCQSRRPCVCPIMVSSLAKEKKVVTFREEVLCFL